MTLAELWGELWRWALGLLALVLSGLVGLVRARDMQEIRELKEQQGSTSKKISDGEARIYDRLEDHARESRTQLDNLRRELKGDIHQIVELLRAQR